MNIQNPSLLELSSSFQSYKHSHLSTIHTFTNENKSITYFYFYKGKRSDYYPPKQLRKLFLDREEQEKELIQEFKQLNRTQKQS